MDHPALKAYWTGGIRNWWFGEAPCCSVNTRTRQKVEKSKKRRTTLSHIMLLWRKGVHLQDRQFYKTYMEIKKRTKRSIENYIVASSSPLRPSSHGTEPSEGTPGGAKQLLHPTSASITIATLCTVQQSLSSVRHGKKVTDWMTWYMANRSRICTCFCSSRPRIPRHRNSTRG